MIMCDNSNVAVYRTNKQEYYTNALLPRDALDSHHVQSSEEGDLLPTELEKENPRNKNNSPHNATNERNTDIYRGISAIRDRQSPTTYTLPFAFPSRLSSFCSPTNSTQREATSSGEERNRLRNLIVRMPSDSYISSPFSSLHLKYHLAVPRPSNMQQ